MPHFVAVGDTNRQIERQFVGVGGVYRPIARRFVGVGGVWRPAFDESRVDLQPASVRGAGREETTGNVISQIEFHPDGRVSAYYAENDFIMQPTIGRWHYPGAPTNPGAFQIRIITVSGVLDSQTPGQQTSGWMSLSAMQLMGVHEIVPGRTRAASAKVQIRLTGSNVVLSEAIFGVSATYYKEGARGGSGGGVNTLLPPFVAM